MLDWAGWERLQKPLWEGDRTQLSLKIRLQGPHRAALGRGAGRGAGGTMADDESARAGVPGVGRLPEEQGWLEQGLGVCGCRSERMFLSRNSQDNIRWSRGVA